MWKKFSTLGMEKLKAGIFDGLQVRELMKDPHFQTSINTAEVETWFMFTLVERNFLENYKADNFSELVESMLSSFRQLDCKMSIKVHYLHSHLDHFPEKLGNWNKEQGEWFHQDLRTKDERCQEHWNIHTMSDYCWFIQHDCPQLTARNLWNAAFVRCLSKWSVYQ